MKRKSFAALFSLIMGVAIGVGSVRAQENFYLREVQPSEGQAGQTLELILRGGGFNREARVEIEGVEIRETKWESSEMIVVVVFIPESAAPGPRTVLIEQGFDEFKTRTSLEGGFHVIGAPLPQPTGISPHENPFPPPSSPSPFPYWLVILGIVGLGIGGAVIVLALVANNLGSKSSLQLQAQTQELPKTCQNGATIIRREKIEFKPGRWKATGLKATLFDSARGSRGETREAPKDLTSKLDRAARQRLLHGENDLLGTMIHEITRETVALIAAWQSISDKGKDFLLEIHLEGGSAEAKFARYRCVQGLWKKEFEWKATLKAADHLQSTFRGPMEDEPAKAYQVFLEDKVKDYVANAVNEAGRLL